MKSKIGFTAILAVLLLSQVNHIWAQIRHEENQNAYIYPSIITVEFIFIAGLVIMERKNLADFHMDRLSIVFFVFSSIFRMWFEVAGEIWFLLAIGASGLLTGLVLIRNWLQVPKTDMRWAGIGFVVGVATSIPFSALEVMSGYLVLFQNYLAPFPFPIVLFNRVIHALSFSAPLEEILIRGFLWGYLMKMGLGENRACWVQAVFFWALHWNRWVFPLILFVAIPLLTFVLSKLVHKSKQVFPALLAHTMANALTESITVTLRWNYQ